MNQELENLIAEVTETNTVMASAKLLIEGFAAQLEAAGTDKAKLTELKTSLNEGSEALAVAVAMNTVAEDEDLPDDTGEGTEDDEQP